MAFYLKNKDGVMWKVAGGGGIAEIPIATENILGGIKSSTNKGYINVDDTTALATVNDNVVMEGSGEIVLDGDFGEGPYTITIDKNPPPSSGIGYDNSISGIDAHTVQDAIDVNAESIKELETKNNSQDTEISELTVKTTTNSENISELDTKITDNSTSITQLDSRVTTNTTNISTNTSNIEIINNRLLYYSNENILDNWYFPNLINQRNLTSYSYTSTSTSSYSIDRWRLQTGITLNVVSGGITVNCTTFSGVYSICQIIENGDKYFGLPFTISLLTENNLFSGSGVLGTAFDGSSYAWTTLGFGNMQILLSSNKFMLFCIRVYDNTTTPVIKAVKFELGSNQTLAHQDSNGNWIINDPPNYQSELARCQRYYMVYDWREKGSVMRYVENDNVTVSFSFLLTLLVEMRTTPVITIVGNLRIITADITTKKIITFYVSQESLGNVVYSEMGKTIFNPIYQVPLGTFNDNWIYGQVDGGMIILDANL